MEGVKPDDFSALLAALNSRSAPPPPTAPYPAHQFQPPQYMWQPVPVQPPTQPTQPKTANTWIIVLLILAAVVFCAIAWMRTTKMKSEPKEEEEEEEEELPAELPVPAQASQYEKQYEKYDEEAVRDFVASNLLNFSKQKESKKQEEEFEIEELPAEIKASSKRIVADESQEVIDYAKRREALFK